VTPTKITGPQGSPCFCLAFLYDRKPFWYLLRVYRHLSPSSYFCGSDSWHFGSLLVPCCPLRTGNTLRPCFPATRPAVSHTCIDCPIRAANAHTDSTFFLTPYQSHHLNKQSQSPFQPFPITSNLLRLNLLLLITCHNLPQEH
jgi:hypothetical protein